MKAILAIAAAGAACSVAGAATYHDLGDFLADNAISAYINFDEDTNGNPTSPGDPIGNTYAAWGVTFPSANVFSTATGPVSDPYMWLNDTQINDYRLFDADITAPNITAVGVHHVLFAGGGTTTLIAYDSGGGVLGTVDGDSDVNSLDFFGLTTNSPIARIEVRMYNWYGWGLDDLYIGQVPAPSSLALLGLGGLALRRRR